MTNYMKEAERLIIDQIAAKFVSGNNVPVDSARITADEWSALLAHIQRGAVPMKLNAGFYTLVAEKPIAEHDLPEWRHMYRIVADDNGRVIGYISDPSMLAAAPAPDQFRDATKMVAEPAEVPMPEPDGTAEANIKPLPGGGYQTGYVDAWSEPLMRTYGAACRAAGEAAGYARGRAEAGRDAVPVVQNGEVLVTVAGLTGSGKSAIAGEIEIMCRALGLDAEWVGGAAEKHLTHADWTESIEMYRPRVRIVEANIPRTDAALRGEVKP